MRGGSSFISLPAGYLGSSFIGAIFIVVGFDSFASKIACFFIAVAFLITCFWARRDWIVITLMLVFSALLVGLWFIELVFF